MKVQTEQLPPERPPSVLTAPNARQIGMPQYLPSYPEEPTTEPCKTHRIREFKTQKRKYQDLWAAILFILVLLTFLAITFIGLHGIITKLTEKRNEELKGIKHLVHDFSFGNFIAVLTAVSFFSGALSLYYFMLLHKFAGIMIIGSIFIFTVLTLVIAVYCFIVGNVLFGVLSVFFLVILVWSYFLIKSRIVPYLFTYFKPFARVLLQAVTKTIPKYPSTIVIAFFVLSLNLMFFSCFVIGIVGVGIQDRYKGVAHWVTFLMAFSFMWILEVAHNIVHVTVSGIFGIYYFNAESSNGRVEVDIKDPSLVSLKTALTTSFGSVCYGSLLIAILRPIQFILRILRASSGKRSTCVSCLYASSTSCIYAVFGRFVAYMNHYAFTQVAIYGKDYCNAARDTWALAKKNGVDALINDEIVSTLLVLAAAFIGLATSAVSCFLVHILPTLRDESLNFLAFGALGFAIGWNQFSTLAALIKSGIASLFVCYAEDSDVLFITKPELYDAIMKAKESFRFNS